MSNPRLPWCCQVLLPCTAGTDPPHCRSRRSIACVCGRNYRAFLAKTVPHPLHAAFSAQNKDLHNLKWTTRGLHKYIFLDAIWIRHYCIFVSHPRAETFSTFLYFGGTIIRQNQIQRYITYPGSNLTLPEPALLSDFVWTSKLLHVLAEVTLSTVLCSSAGLTFSTHSDRALHLRTITQQTMRATASQKVTICLVLENGWVLMWHKELFSFWNNLPCNLLLLSDSVKVASATICLTTPYWHVQITVSQFCRNFEPFRSTF